MRFGWAMLAGGSLARSAPFSGSFLRLSLVPVGRLRRPRPSVGNASRWVTDIFSQKKTRHELT